MHFHLGIKPPGYYKAKALLNGTERESVPLRQNVAAYSNLLSMLEQRLRIAEFNMDLDVFKNEVERLLEQARKLHDEENQQKSRMADAYAVRYAIEEQIGVVKGALSELRADRDYAAHHVGAVVDCPLCHATYDNNFAERFSIAMDEERCIGLLVELDAERVAATEQYRKALASTDEAHNLVNELEALLQTQREELVLQDLLRSEGRRETRKVLIEQIDELEQQLGHLDATRDAARRTMKSFEDRARTEEIEGYYHSEMSRLLDALGVTGLLPDSYRKVESKIKETGSDLPRALLAFNLAMVRTIARYSECTLCPLVIDSPRQQDQDENSWARIRSVLFRERPANMQLILALADDGGTDFGGTVVELTVKRSVLMAEEYAAAANEILPLYEAALSAT